MRFAVILSFSGHIQHYWIYDISDYDQAKYQFNILSQAFIEVNEAQVFLLKISNEVDKARLADVIKQIFIIS